MASPFDALTSGLQAVAMLGNIRAQRDERALTELRLLSELQRSKQEAQQAEVQKQALNDLNNIFNSELFNLNPSAMVGPVASALARMNKLTDMEKLGTLFQNLTKFNTFTALNNALAAFDASDPNGVLDNIVQYQRITTGIPWQGIIKNVSPKGLTIEMAAPTEDGQVVKRQMVVNYDTLLRLATAAAEQPNQFGSGISTVTKLGPEIQNINASTNELNTRAQQNLAQANKANTEAERIRVLTPIDLAINQAEALSRNVEAAGNQLAFNLRIGELANQAGVGVINELTKNAPELSSATKQQIGNFAAMVTHAQLTGAPFDARVETANLTQALVDKELHNKPVQGYSIERGAILKKEDEDRLKNMPADQQAKEMQRLIRSGAAQEIYLYSSPVSNRVPVSQAFANSMLTILGPQFRVSNQPVPVLRQGQKYSAVDWEVRKADVPQTQNIPPINLGDLSVP